MNDSDYETLVESAYNGTLRIGVDRVFARKLYTDIPISTIEDNTGEAPFVEKIIIWFVFCAGPVVFLSSAAVAGVAFRWWAILVIPAALVWWMFNKSASVRGGSPIWLLTVVLAATVIVHFMELLPNSWMSGFISLFIFALWCDRFLYWASTKFLRAFVLRNRHALEAFADGITIRDAF